MTHKSRRHVLALLGSSVVAGCAAPAIVTRNDTDPFEGGIGGTGIVGIVTGFGSILINGLKVELSNRTAFKTALGVSTRDALQPGHSVTIAASRGRDGIVARRVTRDELLIGILRSGTNGLAVNGVRVRLEPGSLGTGRIGQRVAVSGVWRAHEVVASRVDPAPDGPDLVAGTANMADGHVSIGPTVVGTAGTYAALDGSFAVAVGSMTDDQFDTDDLREGRFSGFSTLQQISAEGFLEPSGKAPGFRLAGLGHNFARDTRLAEIGGRRALYFGRYDGLFGANRAYVIPEDLSARRTALRQGLSSGFAGPQLRL